MHRRRTAHRFGEKRRTTDVLIDEKVDFSGLMLSNDVLEGLKSSGFERPSPIQLKAIPLGRCGLDLIAQAKSGTGKTCVFSVIALENINLAVSSVQVLVLAPTREIAVQIKDVMCSIGRHLKGLQTHVFIGGMSLEEDKSHLKHCHIAIGSPGRIKHLIESKLLQTVCIRLFILDEADKLLEENFEAQTNWIFSTLPVSKQMLALSATYPDYLAEKLKNYMKDPTFICLNMADPSLEGICHYRCVVPSHSLPHKVFHEKVQSLLQLFTKLSFHQCLIFSNYQIRARNLSATLSKNGWPSTYISGNQAQNERLDAMAKLKDFKCRILISTDLTSRGIDAERVNLVINMDVPHDSETYLHRVGRAGRFGSYGAAINFVAEGKEVTSLDEIQSKCGVTIKSLPDDVSKILSDEMMDASQKSPEKHEVKSFDELECKETDCKNISKREADNIQHTGKVNNDIVEVDCQMIDNKTAKTVEARNNQDVEILGDKVAYSVVEEDKKVNIQHKEMETKATRWTGNSHQTITAVGNDVNIQFECEHLKNKRKQIMQKASKEIDVQQEELKDKIRSIEAMSDIQREDIVAKDKAEFLNDVQGTENFEIEYQEKESEIKNTQVARNIEQTRIEEKNVDVVVESQENGSLKESIEPQDVISKEVFENKIIRPIEMIEFDKTVDKTDNVDDVSKAGKAIDDEDIVKYKEADTKTVDNEEASYIPKSGTIYRKNLGVDQQKTDIKPNNTCDERITSQECISSHVNIRLHSNMKKGQENAVVSFDMDDLASEQYSSDEDVSVLFVSDSSSEETESVDSSEDSHDSHVPISCKDFDNDFEMYLKRAACSSNEKIFQHKESNASGQSLKSRLPQQADAEKPVNSGSPDVIYADESLPSGTSLNARVQSHYSFGQSSKSAMRWVANNSKPVGALGGRTNSSTFSFGKSPKSTIQEDVDYSQPVGAQGNGGYANEHTRDEPSGGLKIMENNNAQNSEEAMFYGATLDDVTAYMAGLPAEWKRTWYRVYDKQTKFLMNYTKFCHENC